MPLAPRVAPSVSPRLGAPLTLRDRNRSIAGNLREERPSVRRPQPTVPPVERVTPSAPRPAFPVRLRYLILLLAAGFAVRSFGLRAVAYWQLHTTAAEIANYAACMAGPSGPELIHDRPAEFGRLLRRRVVGSAADARPFAACVPSLVAFAGGGRRAAHQARAVDFREYGALRGAPKSSLATADLSVSTARLAELKAAAWPFAPADLDELLRPERTAKVAPHPAAPPLPALGRGLPARELGYSSVRASGASFLLVAGQGANLSAHRSDDGGTTWIEVDADDPPAAALEGQCSSGDGKARFKLRETGDQLRVDSWLAGSLETSFALATADSRLLGFACDGAVALAIVRSDAETKPVFRLCPHLGPCRNLSVPPALRTVPGEGAELSIARVKGVSVISMARDGVVRVISSRDDGETWTPPIVAYARDEQGGAVAPTHLLSLGSKLLLYAGGRSGTDTYASLLSTDFGASWQGR
jgi:hypothetical protein